MELETKPVHRQKRQVCKGCKRDSRSDNQDPELFLCEACKVSVSSTEEN